MRIFLAPSILALIVACSAGDDAPAASRPSVGGADPSRTASAPDTVPFRVPGIGDVKDTAFRSAALRGQAILDATRDSLPDNVGNSLRCTSCHFASGTRQNAIPWVGVYSRFPQFRARSGRVDLIEDRINDCFLRSMNGRALDPASRPMHDIVTYLAFLSIGVPAGAQVRGQSVPKLPPIPRDTVRGAGIFVAQCSRCHGANGEGGGIAPPLWGARSYNAGAGMAGVPMLASFVRELMPYDRPRTLTPQQAYDVASYVDSRPRPAFTPATPTSGK